jgi:FAD/FMN-containing dehydrogenase
MGPMGHDAERQSLTDEGRSRTVTTFRSEVSLDPAAVRELEDGFRGQIVRPDGPAYEERRKIWNGSIDRFPALIARCAGVADVLAAVRFAGRTGLLVAVRGGGHSFPGLSTNDDGVVIDLSLMKGVRVDPEARRVRVQAGVLLGELDRETQAFGLAVPAGIVTHTGVAGLTLGGGIGFIMRKYGLTIDNLLSVDVITAEGQLVRASEDENPDLFWGVRGGGGNFGIVSEFEFRLSPLGRHVVAGPVFWPMEEAPNVLRFYREWIADAPDELMTIVVQRRAPALPVVPPELVGKRVVGVVCCYAGSIEDGEKVVRPLKEFGSPVLDLCVPKPYVAHQGMFDPSFRPGCWYYVRSCDVAELDDHILDVMVEYGRRIASPLTSIALWQMGGAVSRIGEDETAFNGRNAGYTFNINGNTESAVGFEEERAWARAYWSALSPHHTGVYVNFLMAEGEERIRQAYGAKKYDRLKALKRKYDPRNFFRLNQNISPT